MSNENRLDNIKRFYILYIFFVPILTILCLSEIACARRSPLPKPNPDIFVLHSPIQPTSQQNVTYSATIPSSSGIASIIFWEERRTLTLCSGMKCSIPDPNYPTPRTIATCILQTNSCNVINPTEINGICIPGELTSSCQVTVSPYQNNSYVGYKVEAKDGNGNIINSDGYIYFAASEEPWRSDLNWQKDPIPVYQRGAQENKIDLVFIPDKDYDDPMFKNRGNANFVIDTEGLIKEAFFSDKPFSQNIRQKREMWNFYITYFRGDAAEQTIGCGLIKPVNWEHLVPVINSGFIVHNQVFYDCALSLGEDSLFSAEYNSFRTAIHETGHSVFSLADEYSGGRLIFDTAKFSYHNVFDHKTDCDNEKNTNYPNNRYQCGNINQYWFRYDGKFDIMADTSLDSNTFGPADLLRINKEIYVRCTSGNC